MKRTKNGCGSHVELPNNRRSLSQGGFRRGFSFCLVVKVREGAESSSLLPVAQTSVKAKVPHSPLIG